MFHIFAIGGITKENEQSVMAGMLGITGMTLASAIDDGIGLFAVTCENHTSMAVRVAIAIAGTEATIVAGGL